jgi:DNA primase
MDYYFSSILAKTNLNKVEDKKAAAKTLLGVIAKLADKIEQTHYLQKLSAALNVPEDVLRDTLNKVKVKSISEAVAPQPSAQLRDRHVSIGESLVGIAMQHPALLPKIVDQLPPEYLPDVNLQNLYKRLVVFYTEKQTFDYESFVKSLPKDDKKTLTYAEILSLRASHENPDPDPEALEEEVRVGIRELKKRFIQVELKSIERAMRQAEQKGNNDEAESQGHKFSELAAELRHLEE